MTTSEHHSDGLYPQKGVGVDSSLQRGHLSFWKALLLAVSYMQIGPFMAFAAGSTMALAGTGAWAAHLMALLTVLCIGVAIGGYARRYVVTGSLVSYVHCALGPFAGLITAASLVLGYITGAAAVTVGVVIYTTSILITLGFTSAASTEAQCLSAALVSGFATLCAYRGIDASVRVAIALGFLCLPVVITVVALAWLRSGANSAAQFDLTGIASTDLLQGAVLAVGGYVGFDGLTAIAAEMRNPRRNVPRVLVWTLLITGIAIVLGCILQIPVLAGRSAEIAVGISPVAILANAGGVSFLRNPVDLLLVPAGLASTVALYNFGARVIATTASEGLMPAPLAAWHARFHSPHRSAVLMGLAGAFIPLLLQLAFRSSPLVATVHLVTAMAYFWIIPYVLTCAGAVIIEFRSGTRGILTIVSAVAAIAALCYIAAQAFRSRPNPASEYLPYLSLTLLCLVSGAFLCAAPSEYWRRPR